MLLSLHTFGGLCKGLDFPPACMLLWDCLPLLEHENVTDQLLSPQSHHQKERSFGTQRVKPHGMNKF